MADEEQSPEGDALLLYRRADELQGRIAETELRVESLASEIAQIESREAPDYPEEAYRLDDCDKMYAEAKELYNELANRKNQSIFGMLRDCYRMERIREGGMVVACNERDQIHRENPGLAERLERCEAEFREDKALAKNTLHLRSRSSNPTCRGSRQSSTGPAALRWRHERPLTGPHATGSPRRCCGKATRRSGSCTAMPRTRRLRGSASAPPSR